MRRWYHMARALTPILRGSYNEDAPHALGDRLAVGRRALDPLAGVRILLPQPPGHNGAQGDTRRRLRTPATDSRARGAGPARTPHGLCAPCPSPRPPRRARPTTPRRPAHAP